MITPKLHMAHGPCLGRQWRAGQRHVAAEATYPDLPFVVFLWGSFLLVMMASHPLAGLPRKAELHRRVSSHRPTIAGFQLVYFDHEVETRLRRDPENRGWLIFARSTTKQS